MPPLLALGSPRSTLPPHCPPCPQALKVDNLTSLIDERDREVQNIVTSINELAQVGRGRRHSTGGLWVLRGATGAERL